MTRLSAVHLQSYNRAFDQMTLRVTLICDALVHRLYALGLCIALMICVTKLCRAF